MHPPAPPCPAHLCQGMGCTCPAQLHHTTHMDGMHPPKLASIMNGTCLPSLASLCQGTGHIHPDWMHQPGLTAVKDGSSPHCLTSPGEGQANLALPCPTTPCSWAPVAWDLQGRLSLPLLGWAGPGQPGGRIILQGQFPHPPRISFSVVPLTL